MATKKRTPKKAAPQTKKVAKAYAKSKKAGKVSKRKDYGLY
jgi:hypothetical protein